jgi:undecaprenyl-diphosphatase
MIAATAYDLCKSIGFLESSDVAIFAAGFAVSFVSAAAAVKGFIALVQRWSLVPFAWYRIFVAPLIYFLIK